MKVFTLLAKLIVILFPLFILYLSYFRDEGGIYEDYHIFREVLESDNENLKILYRESIYTYQPIFYSITIAICILYIVNFLGQYFNVLSENQWIKYWCLILIILFLILELPIYKCYAGIGHSFWVKEHSAMH